MIGDAHPAQRRGADVGDGDVDGVRRADADLEAHRPGGDGRRVVGGDRDGVEVEGGERHLEPELSEGDAAGERGVGVVEGDRLRFRTDAGALGDGEHASGVIIGDGVVAGLGAARQLELGGTRAVDGRADGGERRGDVAAQKLGAIELGLGGDGVDLAGERLELLIQEAPLVVADRARLRLDGQRLHPHQDVDHLRQAAIGDLEEGGGLAGIDLGLLECGDIGLDLGADGERGGVVRRLHDARAARQLGQRVRGRGVVLAEIAQRRVGGGVGGGRESHGECPST
ncbi:MAG: hypothetical protein R3C69_07810 [Geminicoccaceae bacterium]